MPDFTKIFRGGAVLSLGLCVMQTAYGSTLTFEGGDADNHFVLENLSPYQPNPFDAPDDGADNLATQTASQWVAINPMGSAVANLYWDGGLDGGVNDLFNILLPDTFSLNHFWVAGLYGSQTLTVSGYNNGNLLYQDSIFIDLSPTLFVANWDQIDQLQFITGGDYTLSPEHADAGSGAYWAMDDMVYNENPSPVPVPAAIWMFVSGLALLLQSTARK